MCTCNDPTGTCIMSAFLTNPAPTIFSSCSIMDLAAVSNDGCLFNLPTEVVGDPECGNGILEEGEACDCGTPEECTHDCCDAATCQLPVGAVCATGACCDLTQCTFAGASTECRASESDCDMAEFCSGSSTECPDDETLPDGTSCASGDGYCFNGECPTHDAQCIASFGKHNNNISSSHTKLKGKASMHPTSPHAQDASLN